MELNDRKDYVRGDNSLVIPTDTQKNTVYVAAQKYGVSSLNFFYASPQLLRLLLAV